MMRREFSFSSLFLYAHKPTAPKMDMVYMEQSEIGA